jgi:hypothetical protein
VVPGSSIYSFRAESELDAPMVRVMSVLLDADRVDEWIDRLAESRVHRWIRAPIEYVQYTRFDAPWPVTDRVFLSRVLISIDPRSHDTVIEYHNTKEEPPEGRWLRGYAGGSYYELKPLDGGDRTALLAVGVADPRGSIPVWLVNWIGASWAHDTVMALRAQLARPDVENLPEFDLLYATRPD